MNENDASDAVLSGMGGLIPHALRVPVADPESAARFYAQVFGAGASVGDHWTVDLHGRATVELAASTTPLNSRFPRIVMTYVLDQPSEVKTLVDAASSRGARVLKPAKKALFGSFAGSFMAPDGVVWKLTSEKGKDTAPPVTEPKPREVSLILGVSDPKASRAFYTALGTAVDRDYGSKYVDFRPTAGHARLCLMQSPVLAKDVGVDDSSEAPRITLVHQASSDGEAEWLSAGATKAGGSSGHPDLHGDRTVTDPDGFGWTLIADGGAGRTPDRMGA